MAKASTLFGEVEVNTEVLDQKMIDLSNSSGMAASELGESLYNALSAGIPATEDMTEAIDFLEKSTQLAKAGFTDVDTAVTTTAKILNAYGMEVAETDRIHKILMQTQNNGITTVGELGSVLAQVTPTAAAMNVSFEQVGAGLATMTAAGTPAAQATTMLNGLFAELGKNGTKAQLALAEAVKGTKYAGMSFQDLMKEGVPLSEVIDLVGKQAEKSGLSMLDMFGSLEAGKAALSLGGENAAKYTKNLAAMATEMDVVGDAAGKMEETAAFKMEKMKNQITNLGIELFAILAPIVSDLMQLITDNLPVIQGLMQKLAPIITNLLSGLLPRLISLIDKILPVLIDLFDELWPVIEVAVDIFLDLVDAVLVPLAEILMDIIRKILPIVLDLFKKFAPLIKPLAEAFMNLVTAILPPLLDIFLELVDLLMPLIDMVLPLLVQWIEMMSEMWVELIPIVMEIVKKILPPLVEALLQLAQFVLPLLSGAFEAVGIFIEGTMLFLSNVVGAALEWITSDWETKWTGIRDFFIGIWDSIVAWVKQAWDNIQTFFSTKIPEIIDSVVQFFSELPEKIFYAIGFVIGSIVRWSIDMIKTAKTEIPKIITSILTFFSELPQKIFDFLLDALRKLTLWAEGFKKKIKSTGEEAVNGFLGFFKDLPGKIWDFLTEAAGKLLSIGTTLWNNAKAAGAKIWEGFKEGLGISSPSYLERAMDNILFKSHDMREGIAEDFDDLRGIKLPPVALEESARMGLGVNEQFAKLGFGNGEQQGVGRNLGSRPIEHHITGQIDVTNPVDETGAKKIISIVLDELMSETRLQGVYG